MTAPGAEVYPSAMAITEKSSLDELLEKVEQNDPVQAKLARAREQLQEAKEKLGMRESDDGAGGTTGRGARSDAH